MYPFFNRRASTGRRTENTEAEMGIEFNNTASENTIPKADEVAQTLITAVSNSSNNFSLGVDASSVKIIGEQIHMYFHY